MKKGFIPKHLRGTLTCQTCNRELPISEFPTMGRSVGGYPRIRAHCRRCFYQSAHCGKASVARKVLMDRLKSRCVVCGYDRCKSAIEFHHVDPTTKIRSITAFVQQRGGDQELGTDDEFVAELKKCITICSNCHREHHHGLVDVSGYSMIDVSVDDLNQLLENV